MALHEAEAIPMLCLTERHDCHYYKAMQGGGFNEEMNGVKIIERFDQALLLEGADGTRIYVIAGRQIVTKERIEVLSLTFDVDIPDGQPLEEILDAVIKQGGIPVLSWAPGKWFSKRGKIIKQLIERSEPGRFLIGDTSLRPTIWGEPILMRKARLKGFKILAGSDPLPIAGEESVAGTYGTVWEGALESDDPAASVRNFFREREQESRSVGKRGNLIQVLRRLKKNHDSKKS